MWNGRALLRCKVIGRLGLEVLRLDTRSVVLLSVNVLDLDLDIDYLGILSIQILWLCANLFISW